MDIIQCNLFVKIKRKVNAEICFATKDNNKRGEIFTNLFSNLNFTVEESLGRSTSC